MSDLWAVRVSPRFVVRAVRFGPFPWVVVDTTRDVIVTTHRDAAAAETMAHDLNGVPL